MFEHTGSFVAKTATGEEVELDIYTEFQTGRTSDGPYKLSGQKRIRTSEGEDVNRLGKGRYVICLTGVELTSDDPAAP